MVHIPQKTVKDTPFEKMYDAFISILAGAAGLVEVNTRLRSDHALQRAFGRKRCAEQSEVQETLSACTSETVQQMEQAMEQIYQRHSKGYRHDYPRQYQILDVDLTGLPCGKKAALATKGYFAGARNRRGRQLGRVLATRYGEVVVDQLFEGRTKLAEAFQPLVQAAEQTLGLDEAKRVRTLLRVDAGGGSLADVRLSRSPKATRSCARITRASAQLDWRLPSPGGWKIPMNQADKWAGSKRRPRSMCAPSSALPCANANPMGSGALRP
jgi:hypothetical protein